MNPTIARRSSILVVVFLLLAVAAPYLPEFAFPRVPQITVRLPVSLRLTVSGAYIGFATDAKGIVESPLGLISDPVQVMALTLPVTASGDRPASSLPVKVPEATPAMPGAEVGRQVFVYCTHTSETYVPDAGSDRAKQGPGLILEVARTLADELEDQGLAVRLCEKVHDQPDFAKSYGVSRQSVETFLAEGQNPVAVIDVHRDALPEGERETVMVGGEKCARILLIVGTDQRKPNPDWQDNLALANRIQEKAEKMYPGLVKGVRTKAGVYNQDLFNPSLLIEVGSDRNSLEEAQNAVRHLAGVMAEVLTEGER